MNAELKQAVENLEVLTKSDGIELFRKYGNARNSGEIKSDIQTLLKAVREMGEALAPFHRIGVPDANPDELCTIQVYVSDLEAVQAAMGITKEGEKV